MQWALSHAGAAAAAAALAFGAARTPTPVDKSPAETIADAEKSSDSREFVSDPPARSGGFADRSDVEAIVARWEAAGRPLVASPWHLAAPSRQTGSIRTWEPAADAADATPLRTSTVRELMQELLPEAAATKLGRG